MRNETFFLKTAAPDEHYNESGLRLHEIAVPKELYEFLVKVLNEAELPSQSRGTAKTELYLVVLFITDAVWIVATVVLCGNLTIFEKTFALVVNFQLELALKSTPRRCCP